MFKLNWKKLLLVTLLLAGVGVFLLAAVSLAQTTGPDLGLEPIRQELGLPDTDIRVIAARIIRVALGFLGIVALVLILYGGFTWMTAGGSEEKIQKAKKILMNAVIGLIIILSAYAIVSFVLQALLGATTGGGGGEGGTGGGGGFSNVFIITSMPGNDFGCGARNLHPVIRFNKTVDLTTIENNLVLRNKLNSAPATGTWAFQVVDGKTISSAVVFNPVGDCGVPGHNDCLDASTTYQIFFANSGNIKSQLPNVLSLNCNASGKFKNQCKNTPSVEFATGDGVDVENPTITITNPFEGNQYSQGAVIPVQMTYTDNFGVQDLALFVNDGDVPVDTASISGCKKSGTSTLAWPSGTSPTGTYALKALVTDVAANFSTAVRNVQLLPAHCFDGVLNEGEEQVGPPDCGDGCGYCAGQSCAQNSDCASGWCEDGVCFNRIRINLFDPLDGAASSTYVTISGQFFGDDGGHVYFTKQGGGWTEAFIVSCGAGIDNWTQYQLVVKVPPAAGFGPIKVVRADAPTDGSDDTIRKYTDVTDTDGWGIDEDYTVTNVLKPGLCALIPNYGAPYVTTTLIGENFGATNNSAQDKVMFSSSTALIRSWASRSVGARVPALGTGPVAVKIYNEGEGSNAVRFDVRESLDKDAPVIESINPEKGAKGEYITIIGKNFGNNLGKVLFKLDGGGEAKYGSFSFPADCEGSTWSNNQIIVKFPEDDAIAVNHKYTVQIQRSSDAKIGPIGAEFALQTGDPAPGICKLDPSSGPVPFNPSSSMKIYGEYYQRGGASSTPYFWQLEASTTTIENRAQTTDIVQETDQQAEFRPPNGSQTGPVVMYRDKMGNSLPFTVYNCLENNKTCYTAGTHCCPSGATDAGACKELCAGETRATGYMWRFSTGPFPPVPKVLERCDAGTDAGANLPSPSPDIRWTGLGNFDHFNACRTALVNIEFTMKMDPLTVNASNIQIYKCVSSSVTTTFANDNNICTHEGDSLLLADGSYDLESASGGEFSDTSFMQLFPSALKWADNTWYQVVLKKGIKSLASQYEYKGEIKTLPSQNLVTNNPCGTDTAYCFLFKTNARDCKLNKVVVTPYSYWTSILESPVKYRTIKSNADDLGSDLYYKGNGLSDQHCIMMDMRSFNWSWDTELHPYSTIYGTTTLQKAQVTALANTVAVGLTTPDNAVAIQARAYRDGSSAPTPPPAEESGVVDVTEGLVAWWNFDGDVDSNADGKRETIIDSIGGHNGNASASGVEDIEDGKIGRALKLDGISGKINLGSPEGYPSGTSPRTMCGWGRPESIIDGYGWRWIMAYGNGAQGEAMFIGMDGAILDGGAYGADYDLTVNNFWTAGVWHHVCLVYDGAKAILYGDGSNRKEMTVAWNLQPVASFIGAQASGIEFWKGAVDDIRIYNRALSAEEVSRVYQFGNSGGSGGSEPEGGGTITPEDKTGQSPLTIDLSHPKVVDYWPKCLEACTNAEIGAKFNVIMANAHINEGVVKLARCLDENCTSLEYITSDLSRELDPSDRRYLKMSFGIAGGELATDTVYQVTLSTTGSSTAMSDIQLWSGASSTNEYVKAKPMQEAFTWRFRTKKEKCVLDTVNIIPTLFQSVFIHDRHVYSAEARSAPDACDPKGQRLDTWSIDWRWQSSSTSTAVVQEFKTKGRSPLCNDNCTRKGSDVTSDALMFEPLCGNNIIEAGEDCDPPFISVTGAVTTTVCTLNCLRLGNTNTTNTIQTSDIGLCGDGFVNTLTRSEECDPNNTATKAGCSKNCLHIGSIPTTGAEDVAASICGNGKIGIGEECDLGVEVDYTKTSSSLKCSPTCLHLGTSLSAGWCAGNTSTLFNAVEYKAACAKSKSQCGDGIRSPSEDAGCDCGFATQTPHGTAPFDHMCYCGDYLHEISADALNHCPRVNPACSSNCLGNSRLLSECDPRTTTTIGGIDIVTAREGCGENNQYLGSSLMYSEPSLCGDTIVGIGEEADCEAGFLFTHPFFDPWTLATGVGLGAVATNSSGIPSQIADIQGTGSSTVNNKTYRKSDIGKFEIICGFSQDVECKDLLGDDYGLASNSCCMPRPWLISTYPIKNDAHPPSDICPNTYIEAKFNHLIDEASLANHIYVARGYDTTTSCPAGSTNVSPLVLDVKTLGLDSGPWYKRLWHGIVNWFARIFGDETKAAPFVINSTVYCSEDGLLAPAKVFVEGQMIGVGTTSTVMIRLQRPLATSSDYVVILGHGVRDIQGVSIATSTLQWKFITGDKICELNKVAITPDNYMYNRAGTSNNFIASSTAVNGQVIQPVDGYRWEYEWSPMQSEYVSLTNTTDTINLVTAKNRNGELDLLATTKFTENLFFPDSPSLSGKSRITVFICENPWPSSSTVQFPFKDIQYDFSSYYCMDKGSPGFADDMPFVTSSRVWIQEANPFKKRYLFTNSDNKDAIGMQVFYNTRHLSVNDWYLAQGFSGNMNSLKIDGYDAISDNNNYYIDALDYSQPEEGLYSNIYQFSINNDATADGKEIFKQMMENLKFNMGLKNDKYCAAGYGLLDTVNFNLTCENDLDCLAKMEALKKVEPGAADTYSCLNQKDKLQRNYQRLKDLRQTIGILNYGRGMIAYWPLDSISNSSTPDTTGRGFVGAAMNGVGGSIQTTYGSESGAIQIKSPAYVEIGKPTDIGDRSFTIAHWIKTTSSQYQAYTVSNCNLGDGYRMGISQGKMVALIGNATDYKLAFNCSSSTVNDGKWHHIAAVFDRGNSIKCYVDGVLDGTVSLSGRKFLGMKEDTTHKTRIGTPQCISDRCMKCTTNGLPSGPLIPGCDSVFIGEFDDVRIYSRILPDAELYDLAQGGIHQYKGNYPIVKENSYLNGQALSVWGNSWTQLGTEAGATLPVDPINKLVQSGTCFQKTGLAYLPCYKDSDCATPPQLGSRQSYWSADYETADEGILKNNAAIEGSVDYDTGKGHGMAFLFAGDASAEVMAAHKAEYNSTQFTLSAWIYPTKKNTATIIKHGGTDANGISQGGFVLEYSGFWSGLVGPSIVSRFNNGTVRFAVFTTSTSENKYYALDSNGTPLALNQWHQVVVTVDRDNKTMDMYIDGVHQTNQARRPDGQLADFSTGFPMETNIANIEIGQSFNGKIDNIAYYDSAFDATETLDLYKGLCILHDPTTGWSAEDRRFSFACNTTSYAYRYQYVSSTNSFLLRANMERFENIPPAISSAFYKDFYGDYANLSTGICIGTNEISSPYNLVCGDGVLGGSEVCDPPGKIEIDSSPCPTGQAKKRICSAGCASWGAWTDVGCYSVTGGSCGDGKVQTLAGEKCDDGALNGQSGRCALGCQGVANTCGNGLLDYGEFCDTVTATGQCEFISGAEYTIDPKSEPIFYFLVDLTGTMNTGFPGAPPPGNRVAMVKYSLPLIAERFSDPDSKAKIGVGSYNCPVNSFHNKNWLSGTKGYFTSSQVTTAISTMDHQNGQNTDSVFDWFRDTIYPILNSGADAGKPINLVYITDGGASGSCTPYGAACPTAKITALAAEPYKVVTHIIGVGAASGCNLAAMAAAGGGQYHQITTGADALADAMVEIYKKPCEQYAQYNAYSCRWDCKAYGEYCGDGIVQTESGEECEADKNCTLTSGEAGKQKCDMCKLGDCEAVVEVTVPGQCGNDVVEEDEACDRGDYNGIACDPLYPQKNCTYCSSDCRNVITVDNLCGNGVPDFTAGEMCDPEGPTKGFLRLLYTYIDKCFPCKNDCSGWDVALGVTNSSGSGCAGTTYGYCGDGNKDTVLLPTGASSGYEQCDGDDGVEACTNSCPSGQVRVCSAGCMCSCGYMTVGPL
ncbi:MAG: Ig-like domain-containing protein [Candidatus Magasanikbacteria bacterium]|nr:Ig-like domain-containing protein [Candidatus Magasanikbacteria bacterium]